MVDGRWNWQMTKLSVQYPLAELPYLRSVVVCRPAWYHLHLSPLFNVLDHINHIFSFDLVTTTINTKTCKKDKDRETQTQTKTKCFQDPVYAIKLKSRGFNDFKYDISSKNLPPKFSIFHLSSLNI